jgi:hypothetical protein
VVAAAALLAAADKNAALQAARSLTRTPSNIWQLEQFAFLESVQVAGV